MASVNDPQDLALQAFWRDYPIVSHNDILDDSELFPTQPKLLERLILLWPIVFL